LLGLIGNPLKRVVPYPSAEAHSLIAEIGSLVHRSTLAAAKATTDIA